MAVGTSSKIVKYWECQEYSLVSSTTIYDCPPRAIEFPAIQSGTGVCIVAFDDCTRVLKLDEDNGKSKLLDVITKPCRQVLDLRLSSDSQHLYCLQSNRFIDGPS